MILKIHSSIYNLKLSSPRKIALLFDLVLLFDLSSFQPSSPFSFIHTHTHTHTHTHIIHQHKLWYFVTQGRVRRRVWAFICLCIYTYQPFRASIEWQISIFGLTLTGSNSEFSRFEKGFHTKFIGTVCPTIHS